MIITPIGKLCVAKQSLFRLSDLNVKRGDIVFVVSAERSCRTAKLHHYVLLLSNGMIRRITFYEGSVDGWFDL